MAANLRPYQIKAITDINAEWQAGQRFVVLVMPTGSGKSVTLVELARGEQARGRNVLILAHRRELITQLSETLARGGLHHDIIAARKTIKFAADQHLEQYGRSFYVPSGAAITVGSVQSLKDLDIKRFERLGPSLTVIQDEFHHATKSSKTWGRILTPLDTAGAYGLGPTATPCRSDGQGLSRETDGFGDCIVEGPDMKTLIRDGFLSDYRIFCPPNDIDFDHIGVSDRTGDYKEKDLKAEMKRSSIVGNIVSHYLKICPGKRGITFTVGVEAAEEVAEEFRSRGVAAMALSGTTDDAVRAQAIKDLASGKLLQIVNDSLIGEGVDIPAVEVVLFARPTQSYSLYIQMAGRALRMFPGKEVAIIIDAVGNVFRHGLPDAPQNWTLDRREKRSAKKPADDVQALTTCLVCFQAYHAELQACTWCGVSKPAPGERGGPERIEGDLFEMPREMIEQMRGEIARIDESPDVVKARMLNAGAPSIAAAGAASQVRKRQEAQAQLRVAMSLYGGVWESTGLGRRDAQLQFYKEFNVDVLKAQTLGRPEAEALTGRIAQTLQAMGVSM